MRRVCRSLGAGSRTCHSLDCPPILPFPLPGGDLTDTAAGSMHYHPVPSPGGKWLVYGSKREGVRQLYLMRLSDRKEHRITDLKKGHGAMWPHWQPRTAP